MTFVSRYLNWTGFKGGLKPNLRLIPLNLAMTVFALLYHFNVGR